VYTAVQVSKLTEQHDLLAQKEQSAATVLPGRHQVASTSNQERDLHLVLTN